MGERRKERKAAAKPPAVVGYSRRRWFKSERDGEGRDKCVLERVSVKVNDEIRESVLYREMGKEREKAVKWVSGKRRRR